MAGGDRKNADARLLMALAEGVPIADAARAARVGESTVYRRLQEPDFRQRLSRIRGQMLDRAVGLLADAATAAAQALRALLDAESEGVRLQAARAILDMGTRLRETAEIEGRLMALEEAVSERKEDRKIA